MLERPKLADDRILARLQLAFGLEIISLEFLPIGNDPTAWVYKVSTQNLSYFLKVKRGDITPSSVYVPHHLYTSGIEQIAAPIPNIDGELWTSLADYVLILYPYIVGQTGMDLGLSADQWVELGVILHKIHATHLSVEIALKIPRESFVPNPKWTKTIQLLQETLSQRSLNDALEQELATFWHQHAEEIANIVRRTEELGRLCQARSLPFVICHADFHTANILVDAEGRLFIVDWDGTIFAPKERDLMFIVGEQSNKSAQEQTFLEGYGVTEIDWQTIAYYRYEWVVQEIAEYAELVFLTPDIGEVTRADAVRGFKQLFLQGDVVDQARDSEKWLT